MAKDYLNPEDKNIKALVSKLESIEQKHVEWFKKRPSVFDQQPHDKIDNHIFIEQLDNKPSLKFWKYSELPDSIKTECLVAYRELFSETAA